ncbi:phytanoyl-CoA dioxygenase, partial [Mesorhizobium intechi]
MAPQTAARAIDTGLIDAETIADYQRDGAVCIRGAFKGWV